ncbi:MAG TPA: cytochrome c oxidase assembly protein [Alphaproteobacteria bacterium]|nr:cytochrome c oxidase assembly protein [Alphaproteobacteria bacterium]
MGLPPKNERNIGRRNTLLMLGLFGVVFAMVGVSFAAVPLYDLFCRVTGFGGTTQVADGLAGEVLDREVRVRLTADTDRNLPWRFVAETREVDLRVGEPGLVYYTVENLSDRPLAGTAVYNVNPPKAGLYFTKVECFCFEEQVLEPGEKADLPVYFYVDPSMADDPGMDEVKTITLSYTFFRAASQELDDAQEDYYRAVEQANGSVAGDTKGPDTAMLAR